MAIELPQTIRTDDGLSVEGASADLLRLLLAEYDEVTASLGAPASEHYADGLDAQSIYRQFDMLGLKPTEELLVWWQWHDGLRRGQERQAIWDQLSLDQALEIYQLLPHGASEGTWNPSWVRFAWQERNVGLATSMSSDGPPLVRMTDPVEKSTQAAQTAYQVVSICTPVTWWLVGMTEGWIAWDVQSSTWQIDPMGAPMEWRLTRVI